MLLYAGGKLADYTSYSRGSSLSEQGAEILPWIILTIVVIVIVFLIYKNTDPDKHEKSSDGMAIFIAFMLVWGLPLLLMILTS